MKKYFRLFEECILVDGKDKQCAVYNILTGDVFTFNRKESSVIILCEKKLSTEDILDKIDITKKELSELFSRLIENDIGFYNDSPVYIEKMFMDSSWLENTFLKEHPTVNRAFVILEGECNNECYFCNNEYIRKKSCFGCFKVENQVEKISIEEYQGIFKKLKQLGTKEIYITGGDFFKNFNKNIEILKFANELNFERISVFVGGNRKINKDQLKVLQDNKIHLFLQIEIEDEHSLEQNNLLFNEIKEREYSLLLLFKDHTNVDFNNYIINRSKELFLPLQIFVDYIIRKDQLNLEDRKVLHSLEKTSLLGYSTKINYNPCMYGTLTITSDGNIAVCPRLLDNPLGTINDFESALAREKRDEYWRLNKDKVEKCNLCNLRYVCDDCRFIEYELSGNILDTHSCPMEESCVHI
ncbi:SPASM domain-containing protein (plasmid) [Paraclostridium bifermentans]|uniref:SPASM domain-containing protein n=1 Tax=Paraclostridium bifermentans TaxID=1490 RepID=A0A5P3XKK8_PARBF|nr:radical SAM protein [Paraclostridium bifermentans]QEZ70845.1 SPASM domain-containing protein [Paraclostridium bifermentans]